MIQFYKLKIITGMPSLKKIQTYMNGKLGMIIYFINSPWVSFKLKICLIITQAFNALVLVITQLLG